MGRFCETYQDTLRDVHGEVRLVGLEQHLSFVVMMRVRLLAHLAYERGYRAGTMVCETSRSC